MDIQLGIEALIVGDDGYELIGSTTVICLEDGAWSDRPPVCRRK